MAALIHATVWSVSSEEQYTVKIPGGNFIDISTSTDLNIGDAVKLDSESLSFEGIANSTYTRRNDFGTVKEDLGNHVLVEINSVPQKIWNPNNMSVEPGNAVEIGQADTIINVYPDIDLSLSPFGPDNAAMISSFKENDQDDEDEDEEEILTFNDFGGMTVAQNQFRERVELFLKASEALDEVGTEPRMGALFYGPPGTGKTHFARILSNSLNAMFYRIRGPEIVSKGVGDTEKLIREIFDDAEKNSPSIIFFDEIDSIAIDRGSGETRDFSQRIVAQLLSVIDGYDRAEENVFVIAATNQIDEIDEALLRPGRFDWKVHFPMPNDEHRREIFQTLQEDYDISDTVTEENIDQILIRTDGWTGAKLRALLNEAGILCVKAERDEIRHADLMKAYERIKEQQDTNRGK